MKQDRTRAPWAVTLATLKGFNMLLISYTVQQALYLHVQVHERSCLPLLDNDTLGCILLRNSNVISLAKQGVTLISPESTSKTPVGCSIRFFLIHCTTFFPQSSPSFFYTNTSLVTVWRIHHTFKSNAYWMAHNVFKELLQAYYVCLKMCHK